MRSPILLASVLVAGCGAAEPTPASGPPATEGECTAGTGDKLPMGWVDTGATIQVTMKLGKPSAIEGHAADGAVHQVPMPPEGKEKEALAREICRLGGLVATVDDAGRHAKEGPVLLHVGKPAAPSEQADLALFCAGPPDPRIASGGFDASQVRTLAMVSLHDVLTTPRWRGWIRAQGRRVQAAEGPAKDKIYGEMIAELRAAGAPANCWFAGAVLPR